MKEVSAVAKGDMNVFNNLWEKYVKGALKENPWLLSDEWWSKHGDEWLDVWNEIVEEGLK